MGSFVEERAQLKRHAKWELSHGSSTNTADYQLNREEGSAQARDSLAKLMRLNKEGQH